MPKSTKPYVLVYISVSSDGDEPVLCHETIADEDEAKTRFAELAKETGGDVLVFRDTPTPAEIETTPRVTFGVAHKPLDKTTKPRKPRSDKGKTRKNDSNLSGSATNENARKANGVESVS